MRRFWPRNFKKKARFLGELEREVMDTLWKESPLSGREVYERLSRNRTLALTTILTILNRLVQKGFVRKASGKKVYLFQPTISRDEWQAAVGRELLLQALNLSPQTVLSTFANVLTTLPSDEFLQLMAEVEKKRHEKHP